VTAIKQLEKWPSLPVVTCHLLIWTTTWLYRPSAFNGEIC